MNFDRKINQQITDISAILDPTSKQKYIVLIYPNANFH
jgi:hypothetical protein